MPAGTDALLSLRGGSPEPLAAREEVGLDEALQRSVGEFGWGQRWLFLLVSLAWAPDAMQTVIMVFAGLDPLRQGWWRCTSAQDGACAAAAAQQPPDVCGLPRDAWAWTHPNRSIVSEWDLVCGRSWGVQAANSGFFLGFLVGAGLFGAMSDRYGRRRALFAACGVAAVAGGASAAAPSLLAYLLLRGLTGVGVGGMGLVAAVLATEPIGPSWRGTAGIAIQYFFAAGACATPLLAYLVPGWRAATFLAASGSAAFLTLWPYVPESPRWLLAVGRKGEATAALAAIASANRTHLPDAPLADGAGAAAAQRGMLDVLAHGRLRRRLAVLMATWFALCMAYYGTALQMGALSGNLYLNQFLGFVVEFPAYALLQITVDRVGRRLTFAYCLLEGGGACILCALTSGWVARGAAVAGKAGLAASFALAYLYTTELFPTVVRSAVLGACSQAARLGGVAAPALVHVGAVMGSGLVPLLVFGGTTAAAGLLALSLPETLGAPLPESFQDISIAPPRRMRWSGWRSLLRPKGPGLHFAKLATDDEEASV